MKKGASVIASGTVIDERYVVERILRRGGRGVAYVAVDRTAGDPVVVKVARTGDPAVGRDMEREITALRSIHSAHVPVLRGAGRLADGRPYLACPLVAGAALDEIMERHAISPTDALDLAIALSHALKDTHSRGWLHRDVKPGNVIVPMEGARLVYASAVLIDFGVCRLAHEGNSRDATFGHVGGTPLYMAPEQIAGRLQTAATDVYGVGTTLFHALYGRPIIVDLPVELTAQNVPGLPSAVMGSLVVRLLTTEIAMPESPGVPSVLKDLLSAMLRRRPESRPQSASELLVACERVRIAIQLELTQRPKSRPGQDPQV
jgi:eukaryotic-like serine/threonine-protein kinase